MLDIPKAAFSFLAFHERSQKLLAYGHTASEASKWGQELAPDAPIQVLSAGVYGRTMWNRKFSFAGARRALNNAQNVLEGDMKNSRG
jgi:hypothetical protein